jgi:hypothetical protein
MNESLNQPQLIQSIGPWPFITRRVYRQENGKQVIWQSRHHRKQLKPNVLRLIKIEKVLWQCLWMPKQLNWWIGLIFALGSLLFMLGSLFSLAPLLAKALSLQTTTVNALFFAGSIPFTTAAYLQLFQVANAGKLSAQSPHVFRRIIWFGWYPKDIGWLSCALQFIGTILFNFNTFDAMLNGLKWFEQDLTIWIPDFLGSIFFLISGYLAFIEVCHTYWAWQWGNLSWWVTFTNLLGCIAFMISACFAFVLPNSTNTEWVTLSLFFTLLGALGFFIGSLLMLPESIMAQKTTD